MRKFLFLFFVLAIILPVSAADSYDEEYADTTPYMDFTPSDFGHSYAVKQQKKKEEAQAAKSKGETYEDFLNEFDSEGFRKEKPVSTEKKVIKKIGDNRPAAGQQNKTGGKPMTYSVFPQSFDDAQNGMMTLPTLMNGMF